MDNLLQVPPHSLEAEQAVVGGVMLNPMAMPNLQSEVFYRTGHQLIWEAIKRLESTGRPIDILTVGEELRAAGDLEKVGGNSYLIDLNQQVPSSSHIAHYAAIVEGHWARRKVITAGHRLLAEAYQQDSDCGEVIGTFLRDIDTKPKGKFQHMKEVMREVLQETIDAYENKTVAGFSTGYEDLDRYCRPLPGELVIIAGRPAMGKTAFALNMAANLATQGKKGGIFTLEMISRSLGRRLVSQKSKVSGKAIKNGQLHEETFLKISSAVGQISEYEIFIDSSKRVSSEYIRHIATSHHRKHGLDFVVIDHLQMVKEPGRQKDRHIEVSEICMNLSVLASELGIVVFLVTQLNRDVEKRNPPIPMMSDLKESGGIEENADTVLLLYRPEYYKKAETPADEQGIGYVIIGKQREGETGMVKLAWLGECTSYESLY